jgi:hypothetical protein
MRETPYRAQTHHDRLVTQAQRQVMKCLGYACDALAHRRRDDLNRRSSPQELVIESSYLLVTPLQALQDT